jgi:periplasmic divalent cation tolerance protein
MTASDDAAAAVLVLTTTADDESARALSRALVEEGLAACVTRMPVRSVFRWESQPAGGGVSSVQQPRVCEEEEVLLVIKAARVCAAELERRIVELHPYECAEVIRIVPEHVEAKYLAWLLAACAAETTSD